ncbi:uncharacterized protein MONBRDRAFT_32118 [Monosiga brevicollis MX1]|uniref:Ataxin-10 domain-containing protein n=1 Tax=Monosiga brevicollis TaxID=81824 RepID=A9UXR9_MONBE|nr:uncharacterized protein MONBRDRAFT_32118 [Monosiga brevicollis MX1]EDQ89736.1 predicted protein [Monosiga brevicollis MX1]|eukprot:XP_001745158.1 hypothetical protein [Monosiga brevicollis MX1]
MGERVDELVANPLAWKSVLAECARDPDALGAALADDADRVAQSLLELSWQDAALRHALRALANLSSATLPDDVEARLYDQLYIPVLARFGTCLLCVRTAPSLESHAPAATMIFLNCIVKRRACRRLPGPACLDMLMLRALLFLIQQRAPLASPPDNDSQSEPADEPARPSDLTLDLALVAILLLPRLPCFPDVLRFLDMAQLGDPTVNPDTADASSEGYDLSPDLPPELQREWDAATAAIRSGVRPDPDVAHPTAASSVELPEDLCYRGLEEAERLDARELTLRLIHVKSELVAILAKRLPDMHLDPTVHDDDRVTIEDSHEPRMALPNLLHLARHALQLLALLHDIEAWRNDGLQPIQSQTHLLLIALATTALHADTPLKLELGQALLPRLVPALLEIRSWYTPSGRDTVVPLPRRGFLSICLRLVGNLLADCPDNVTLLRTHGGIPAVMSFMCHDTFQPQLYEWTALAIRHICAAGPENLAVVQDVQRAAADAAEQHLQNKVQER